MKPYLAIIVLLVGLSARAEAEPPKFNPTASVYETLFPHAPPQDHIIVPPTPPWYLVAVKISQCVGPNTDDRQACEECCDDQFDDASEQVGCYWQCRLNQN